jgi:hypothetical protein
VHSRSVSGRLAGRYNRHRRALRGVAMSSMWVISLRLRRNRMIRLSHRIMIVNI